MPFDAISMAAPVRVRPRLTPTTIAALVAFALLVSLSLLVPVDHDEGQYLSATHFVAQGLMPYLDFPYLQTPLQPFLLAPLAWIAPGWLLLASRLLNAAAVALSAWLIGKTAMQLGGREWLGPATVVAMLAFDSILFGGSVARNDALPLLFFSFGLERLFGGHPLVGRRRALAAGIALSFAASTKISYALPAAVAAVQVLWHSRRRLSTISASFLTGLCVGALPVLLFLLWTTEQFLFGAIHYSIDGVRAWQELRGATEQLTLATRAARLTGFLALGPGLFLLILAAVTWSKRDPSVRPVPPIGTSLGPILLAAMVAAILPMPTYRQYLIPIVPPLLLWISLHAMPLLEKAATRPVLRPALATAGLFCLTLGFGRSALEMLRTPSAERPLAVEAQAHQIGDQVRAASLERIAGLDPVRLVDSGLAVDPRFAAGPFLFRAGNLDACRSAALCPVTFASLARLNHDAPQAMLTGSERKAIPLLARGLDGKIDDWAASRGYRAHKLGSLTLWLHFPHH